MEVGMKGRVLWFTFWAGMLLQTGCDVYVIDATNSQPQMERRDTKQVYGDLQYSCTTISGLYDKINHDHVAAGCSVRPVSVLIPRGYYQSFDGRRVEIWQYRGEGFVTFYTYKDLGRRSKERRPITDAELADISERCAERHQSDRTYEGRINCVAKEIRNRREGF